MLTLTLLALFVVALPALLLFLWGWNWDRSRGQPRCPRCWYSLHGLPELRCPECGCRPRSAGAAFRTRRNRWLIGIAPALAAGLSAFVLSDRGQACLLECLPRWEVTQEFAIGDYCVQTLHDRQGLLPSEFVISFRGERVHVDGDWNIGCVGAGGDGDAEEPVGTDILGTGMPTVVLHYYSGGAHCCSTYMILGLPGGGAVVPLASIDGAHTGCEFRDLDHDGVYECVLRDWTFAYWNTCYAGSPAPQVILRWKADRLELATDLMAAPAPSESALAEQAQAIIAAARDPDRVESALPPPEYWSPLLDLIFSGNAASAWRLANLAWPPELDARDKFLESFRAQLEKSSYWPELRAWNERSMGAWRATGDEIATREK